MDSIPATDHCFSFYGYTVRATTEADLALALEWCKGLPLKDSDDSVGAALDSWMAAARFWIDSKEEPQRQNFLVIEAGQARCKCGHLNVPDHFLTSQDEEGELWCRMCSCRQYQEHQPNIPLAFFQRERVNATQVRLAFQASPVASRKKILRGITKLVPLMEKGLASGGVRHIFFTSHSLAMIAFMEKRMGYRLAQNADGGLDGAVMFKEISGQWPVASGQPNRPIHGQTAERGAK